MRAGLIGSDPRAMLVGVSVAARYDETITLPRAVRFPVELIAPPGFDPEEPRTWPRVDALPGLVVRAADLFVQLGGG